MYYFIFKSDGYYLDLYLSKSRLMMTPHVYRVLLRHLLPSPFPARQK